jgi:hypothetical protein
MDFKEMGCENVDWINLAHDRDKWLALVNTNGLLGSTKCREFLD